MLSFQNLADKYYQWWMRLADFKSKVRLYAIDFKKPWWSIIAKQKKYITYIILAETIDNIFYYVIPLSIGYLIATKQLSYFFIFIIGWLIAISIEYLALYYSSIVHMQTGHSILYSAHQFFLTVDPIYHTTRSSGKIIGKIDRGVNAFEEFIDLIAFELLTTIIGLATVTIAFFKFNTKLGLLALSIIIFIGIFNTVLQFLSTQAFEPRVIQASDKLNAVSLENLSQISYIRSCFASNEIDQTLRGSNISMMDTTGTSWLAFSALSFATRFAFILGILILGSYLIMLIHEGKLSIEWGSALLITFINGSYETMRVGKKIKRFLKAITRIKDLFSFIKDFGKQTFPVLSMQTAAVDIPGIKKATDTLILDIQDLYFDYDSKAKIFENHYLELEVPHYNQNKLYGIIGPSGSGKTTFISILGGQLHPTRGFVKIQDVEIYHVDDFTRKHLVALQGQVATSLRGTIRSNLLFGLPKDNAIHTDSMLISILESVGLWQLFHKKMGLETIVGESGLTLSGGQRQRLNFANLYLRAKFYSPALILIDEPTSSLDEISEKAITNMIDELAQTAITFVIAHRINTLEQAVKILDFSLLSLEKEIKFLPIQELAEVSPYYKKLVKGEITLE
jgi:ABC-type multidrug transport system fused ATPase/permease subunit